MQRNRGEENQNIPEKQTIREEIWEVISTAYKRLENWVRPKKGQPVLLQILIFVLKLPVLFLLLLFSPVLLVVLLLVFLIAL
ncbi:hypothetical protein C5745_12290 [Sphingobacterium haloxyli]|uniref:Uncharacterized protein n=1 Tax=Sphingobacterium haloxyli TaxID=2100533 RepID=A0A2S9J343_9SPHI|nr:hypothetical protein C5745_12290 [Sphingobacterium haloxyli]